jgi:signal transduction histidine kinase
LAEETARGAEALEAERAQIARDLHDVVSHAMAVTLMQARGGRRIQATNPGAAQAAFDAIEHTNTQALGDMRRMLNVLRETDTPDQGSLAPMPSLRRLTQLIDQVQTSGVGVQLTVEGDLDQVPPGVDLSAYRVIQEALTNVLKHAAPATATVIVDCGTDQLDINITDNGTRPTSPPGGGHGLNGMKERVEVLGGEIHTGPATPSGFTVQARLPYQVIP